jgi:small subunit ribosomal protein S16
MALGMSLGRPKAMLELTAEERQKLAAICFKGPVSAILRCCDSCGRAHLSGHCCAGRRGGADTRRPGIPQQSSRNWKGTISVVMIRLARVGAPKQPYYRIVVIEKDRARNGRSIEVVGTYNPRTNPASVDLKYERIAYWRGKGAKLSPILEKLVAKNPAKVAEPVQNPVLEPAQEPVPDPAAA